MVVQEAGKDLVQGKDPSLHDDREEVCDGHLGHLGHLVLLEMVLVVTLIQMVSSALAALGLEHVEEAVGLGQGLELGPFGRTGFRDAVVD